MNWLDSREWRRKLSGFCAAVALTSISVVVIFMFIFVYLLEAVQ